MLLADELLQASSEGTTVYYYVVLEYPNLDEPQNIDINGTFNGIVSIKSEYGTPQEPDEPEPEPDPDPDEPDPEPEPEIILLGDKILEDNGGKEAIEVKGTPNFSLAATTNEGMYAAAEGNGTTYYYRGNVSNNYVEFAGFYWRIVRINANGSVRLIYQGNSSSDNGQISTSNFNDSSNHNAYVGYMYGDTGTGGWFGNAPDYNETHTNTTSSAIKQALDNWYLQNSGSFGSSIDTSVGFCGDRSLSSGSGASQTDSTYAIYGRIENSKNPSFNCTNTNDLYTVSGAGSGNQALQYPVGLISADEVAFAGGVYGTNNISYYLYTGSNYWTMTPYELEVSGSIFSRSYTARNIYVGSSLAKAQVNSSYGVRPVINVKGDIQVTSGTGSSTEPYVLQVI